MIDPRTLRPLDLDTILASVRKTNRCVIVEEGWPHGGVGANLGGAHQRTGLRRPRRAGAAGHRSGRADALREAAGAGLPSRDVDRVVAPRGLELASGRAAA